MKTCNKCLQPKDESEFAFKNKTKNLLQAMCKECYKLYAKSHYNSNKDSYVSKAKRNNAVYLEKNKNYVDNYKKTHSCLFCSESEPACLDFHHLRDKTIEVSKIMFGSLERLQSEIDKCVVLCANCHRKLHAGLLTIK